MSSPVITKIKLNYLLNIPNKGIEKKTLLLFDVIFKNVTVKDFKRKNMFNMSMSSNSILNNFYTFTQGFQIEIYSNDREIGIFYQDGILEIEDLKIKNYKKWQLVNEAFVYLIKEKYGNVLP